ncbi:hypothetical protein GUJ93_ZPchr0006g43145 [Zizania palustris]|uniref:Uncharacterized protein n=1 Tax=Zizania palustris TaxID=103762 RepID=A0A8J5SBM9_ZIZPA|nr:hypothetical protein GUJ93_ZPchr0006g43145 [Zizania palustris]
MASSSDDEVSRRWCLSAGIGVGEPCACACAFFGEGDVGSNTRREKRVADLHGDRLASGKRYPPPPPAVLSLIHEAVSVLRMASSIDAIRMLSVGFIRTVLN